MDYSCICLLYISVFESIPRINRPYCSQLCTHAKKLEKKVVLPKANHISALDWWLEVAHERGYRDQLVSILIQGAGSVQRPKILPILQGIGSFHPSSKKSKLTSANSKPLKRLLLVCLFSIIVRPFLMSLWASRPQFLCFQKIKILISEQFADRIANFNCLDQSLDAWMVVAIWFVIRWCIFRR